MSTSICLEQIDRCRPFFIGILGERYGWVPESFSDDDIERFPILANCKGKSITEIEMRYGALEVDSGNGFCAFYLRDNRLTDSISGNNYESVLDSEIERYGAETAEKMCADRKERLITLKEEIIAEQKNVLNGYKTIEEFESKVYEDFISWLESTYPKAENIIMASNTYYIGESMRVYLPDEENIMEFDSLINQSNTPVVLYGDSGSGKTAFLNYWSQHYDRDTINICVGANDGLSYWVETAIQIINQINEIYPDVKYPDMQIRASMFFWLMDSVRQYKEKDAVDDEHNVRLIVTDEEEKSFRISFAKWLSELECPNPLYIIINDANLLDSWGGLDYLPWLPLKTTDNVHIIISTNSPNMLDVSRMREWTILKFYGMRNDVVPSYKSLS